MLRASRRTAPAVVDYYDDEAGHEEGMGASRGKDIAALALAGAASLAILVNALFLQSGPHPAPMFSTRPVAPQPSAPQVVERNVRAVGTELTGAAPQPRARPADSEAVKPEVAARSRLEVIADIQTELARRGFYDGGADGVYGPKTDAAVRDFAHSAGVKLGSEPTEAMLQQIQQAGAQAGANVSSNTKAKPAAAVPHHDPIAELLAPSPAKRIVAVQRALSDFGYGQIKATGTLDAPTQEAISRFERSKKMPVTGQMSQRLLRELSTLTGRPLE